MASLLARAAVTVVLCGAIISRLGVSGLRDCLASLRFAPVAAAGCVALTVMCLHCLKWSFIVHRSGGRLPFAMALRATWGGAFVNHLLPGRLGGDLLRAYIARDVSGGMARGLGYLALDRVANLLAMLITAAVMAPSADLPVAVKWALVAMGVGVVPGVVVAARIDISVVERRGARVRWIAHACRLLRAVQDGVRDPGLFIPLIVLGGGVMALVTLVNVLAGHAIGISVDVFTFWSVVSLAHTVTLIPVTLGGVGLRESLFAYLFESAGATLEQGTVLSLLTRVIVMACSLPGGVWLLMTGSLPSQRAVGELLRDDRVATGGDAG